MLSIMHPFAAPTILDAMVADALRTQPCHAKKQRHVHESDEAYTLTLAAPGLSAADLNVSIDEDVLTVRGKSSASTVAGHYATNHRFNLPRRADAENVSVSTADGLITITIPKRAPAEPTMVPVSTEPSTVDVTDAPRYTLTIQAPGLAAVDLAVQIVEDGTVAKVSGETKRTGVRIDRSFRLPLDTAAAGTQASHIDGILTLSIPKVQPTQTHIAVNATRTPAPTPRDEEEFEDVAEEAEMKE